MLYKSYTNLIIPWQHLLVLVSTIRKSPPRSALLSALEAVEAVALRMQPFGENPWLLDKMSRVHRDHVTLPVTRPLLKGCQVVQRNDHLSAGQVAMYFNLLSVCDIFSLT